VGVVRELSLGTNGDPEVEACLQRARGLLRSAGALEVALSIPLGGREGISIYYIVAPAEASSNLARFDGVRYGFRAGSDDLAHLYARTRGEGFGAEVRRRILLGTFVLSAGYADAFYKRAMAARAALRAQFDAAFRECDVLLSATTPTPAFRLGEKSGDPVQMYLCDVLTVVANLAGVPALALPAGTSRDGLPIGLQVWAPHGRDDVLLSAAATLEGLLAHPFRAAALPEAG
jgi:aspartyl-tRNA(Asn)/glutamyl-tRNA(Gln) amidotransferase subunit A